MTLGTRLVQMVDWCLGVSLALGFCTITDCVMKMSEFNSRRRQEKPFGIRGTSVEIPLKILDSESAATNR